MRPLLLCLAGCVLAVAATLHADIGQPADIPTRARGAERVLLAKVADVSASFATTEQGDQIIVSHVVLLIEETLKGDSQEGTLSVDVEGGTVGDITMEASDMPAVRQGARAVFFLRRSPAGKNIPHLRGQGIIEIEPDDRVAGTSLTLDAIRTMVRGAQQ